MEKIPNVTTGEILLEEFLEPANISVSQFAQKAGFSLSEALNIISGKMQITPDVSDKINKGAGCAVNWVGMQSDYEQREAIDTLEKLEYMAHRKRENIQNNKGKEDFQDLKELVDTICKI